jgi:hypothetical protein
MYRLVECSKTGAKMIVNSEDTNLKKAGVLSDGQDGTEIPDEEVMETMLAFSRGETYSSPNSYTAKRNNVFQGGTRKNIKQASVDDIEMLNILMEFGGYNI